MYQLVDSIYRPVHVFKYFFKYEKSKFNLLKKKYLVVFFLNKKKKEVFNNLE
jgi:hypothetical protein